MASAKEDLNIRFSKSESLVKELAVHSELGAPFGSQIPLDNPFLYMLRHSGKQFYLFGSQHDYPLQNVPDSLKDFVKSIKFFVGESEPEKCKYGVPLSLAKMGKYKKGEPSQFKELSLKARKTLFSFFHNHQKAIRTYKPWVLFYMYVLHCPEIQEGIDMGFEDIVLQEGGITASLETQADIVSVSDCDFQSLTPEQISSFLSPVPPRDLDRRIDSLCNKAYCAGDVNAIALLSTLDDEAQIKESSESHLRSRARFESFSREFLVKRNEKWVPKILDFLSNEEAPKPMMVVVGLEHILGKQGLLDLFSQRGFSIHRHIQEEVSKKDIFFTSYLHATLTPLPCRVTKLINSYLYSHNSPEKQAIWETSVIEPPTLWAYNLHLRAQSEKIPILTSKIDEGSLKKLWKLGV